MVSTKEAAVAACVHVIPIQAFATFCLSSLLLFICALILATNLLFPDFPLFISYTLAHPPYVCARLLSLLFTNRTSHRGRDQNSCVTWSIGSA